MQRLILLPALMLAGIACTDVTSPTPFRPFLSVQASENPFVGSWENLDVDGSQEHVTISNSSSIQVHLRDDGATFCLNAGLGFVPATFAGVGVIVEGDPLTLEVIGDIYCYPRDGGGRQLMAENVTIPFFYNPASNTLSIFSGDCWYRSGRPESCGIGNPFVGSWENIDVDGSHEHVTISKGSSIRVHLRDDGATFCLNAGLGFVPATFAGVGVISEGEPLTLEVTGDIYCYPRDGGGRQLMAESVTIPFFYNSTSNTLSIFSGDCWYRSGHPESCA